MAPTSIKLNTMASSLALILAAEALGWGLLRTTLAPLVVLAIIRLVQIGGIIGLVSLTEGGLHTIGWAPETWAAGIRKGALWSLGFALAAALAMAAVYLAGRNPLRMLHAPLPRLGPNLFLFLLVGGFIGPLAEELCFRGLLFTYFRRWGFWLALAASTALFVVLHAVHGLPVVQIVGGVVFAISYETSRNLMVPLTIHVLGNLSIFTLSLAG